MLNVITPHWPAPTNVRAFTTLREGGASRGAFSGWNFGRRVPDEPSAVWLNRLRLNQQFNFHHSPVWLKQTHSTRVVEIQGENTLQKNGNIDADGAYTQLNNIPCVVLTADCLPLVLCDSQGTVVSAVHCGWRGLLNGIIENAVQALNSKAQGELMAWMGPAIGPRAFEVGNEVREAFISLDRRASKAFVPSLNSGKWMANLYMLATQRLQQSGVNAIYGEQLCTFSDTSRFYSYRKEGMTGRMATVVWIA